MSIECATRRGGNKHGEIEAALARAIEEVPKRNYPTSLHVGSYVDGVCDGLKEALQIVRMRERRELKNG